MLAAGGELEVRHPVALALQRADERARVPTRRERHTCARTRRIWFHARPPPPRAGEEDGASHPPRCARQRRRQETETRETTTGANRGGAVTHAAERNGSSPGVSWPRPQRGSRKRLTFGVQNVRPFVSSRFASARASAWRYDTFVYRPGGGRYDTFVHLRSGVNMTDPLPAPTGQACKNSTCVTSRDRGADRADEVEVERLREPDDLRELRRVGDVRRLDAVQRLVAVRFFDRTTHTHTRRGVDTTAVSRPEASDLLRDGRVVVALVSSSPTSFHQLTGPMSSESMPCALLPRSPGLSACGMRPTRSSTRAASASEASQNGRPYPAPSGSQLVGNVAAAHPAVSAATVKRIGFSMVSHDDRTVRTRGATPTTCRPVTLWIRELLFILNSAAQNNSGVSPAR